MIKKLGKRPMKESYGVYDLIDYFDVWGNEEDGWDVNNLAKVESDIWLDDDLSDDEIVNYLIDQVWFFSPKARGNIEVIGDGDFIEFFNAETGEPLGRLERTRTANGKSFGESKSRKARRKIKEDIDLDTARDDCQMRLLQLIDMLDDLKAEISDLEYSVTTARSIDDKKFDYGFDNCKQSIDNAFTYISYIRNSIR